MPVWLSRAIGVGFFIAAGLLLFRLVWAAGAVTALVLVVIAVQKWIDFRADRTARDSGDYR